MQSKAVLLFGGGLQVLAIARELSEAGYVVDVAGAHNQISSCSRYVRQCHKFIMEDLTVDAFVAALQQQMYCVIIPMEDEYAEWLSRHKTHVEEQIGAKCAVMRYDIFCLASDKSRLLSFCREHNIPHPRTADLTLGYEQAASCVGFPALIKPAHSAGSRGIRRVDNMTELQSIAPTVIAEYGSCALQEFIQNDHYYNVMLYRTAEGRWGNHTITRIKRFYPINGGSSSLCETIENKALLECCCRLLDKLKWVGFADFDVLEKGEGDFRIIEINPRIPASVRAASVSGVHFGVMIVADLMGEQLPVYTYQIGQQLRCLGLDLAWFVSSPDRFRAKPSWFRFLGANLFYQEGGIHDMWAMLMSLYIGMSKFLSPSFRRQKSGMNN